MRVGVDAEGLLLGGSGREDDYLANVDSTRTRVCARSASIHVGSIPKWMVPTDLILAEDVLREDLPDLTSEVVDGHVRVELGQPGHGDRSSSGADILLAQEELRAEVGHLDRRWVVESDRLDTGESDVLG